jgi:transposase-like protein
MEGPMKINKMYTKSERQQHIEEWKKSLLSKSGYAKSAGISPTTFYNWFSGANTENQSFIEINHQGKILDNTQEIIIEKGSITIRIPLSSGTRELQTIFEALGGV